jgi:hypothetical protein
MLSGKVLRINVDVTDFIAGNEYSIPSDNPFSTDESLGLPEIYAWGLRNPSKCSIDRGKYVVVVFCTSSIERRVAMWNRKIAKLHFNIVTLLISNFL